MSDILFVEYPKCSTCRRAKAWLDEHGIAYVDRRIVEEPPTASELAEWQPRSGLPLRRFFNTSGKVYREQGIKAKLDAGLSDEDAFELLSANGMLVKRPILVGGDFVLVGFREPEWETALLENETRGQSPCLIRREVNGGGHVSKAAMARQMG